MKQTLKTKVPIKKNNHPNAFVALPNEIHLHIFSHITPLNNWNENYLHLLPIASTAHILQQTCKLLRQSFSVKKIAPLMRIDYYDKDIFLLINTAQAGIPGLVSYAINRQATIDYINTENKQTPLTIAAQENNYKCCLYLLNASADTKQPHDAYRPIEIATRNSFF